MRRRVHAAGQRKLSTFIAGTLVSLTVALTLGSAPALADAKYGNFYVGGRIETEYLYQGGPSKLGNPTNAESNAARNGKFQNFANAASIYWNAGVANGYAKMVRGAIRDKWAEYDYENGPFKFPTISEATLAKNNGKYNTFEGGSIYYSQATGAHQVWGAIRDKWGAAGYETGSYGYPVTDEYELRGGFQQVFEGGVIDYNVSPEVDADPNNTNPIIGGDDPYNKYMSNRIVGDADQPGSTCNVPDQPEAMADCVFIGDEKYSNPAPPNDTNARRAPSTAPSEPPSETPPSDVPTPDETSPSTSTPVPSETTPSATTSPAPSTTTPTPSEPSSSTTTTTVPAAGKPTSSNDFGLYSGKPLRIQPALYPDPEPVEEPGEQDHDIAEENAFFTGNTYCINQPYKVVKGKRFLACNAQKVTFVRAKKSFYGFGDIPVGFAKGWLYSEISAPVKANGSFEQQPLVRIGLNITTVVGDTADMKADFRAFTDGGLEAGIATPIPYIDGVNVQILSKPRARFTVQDTGINTGTGLNKVSTFRPKLGISIRSARTVSGGEQAYALSPIRCD